MSPVLAGLFRYPVKGLGGEAQDSAALGFHAALPGDRVLAPVRRGPPPVLLRKPAIATISARMTGDPGKAGSRLALAQGEILVAEADPSTAEGRLLLAGGLAAALGIAEPLDLAGADSFRGGYQGPASLSLMAAASVTALGERLGIAELDPRRFRSNLVIDGLAANEELGWRGRHIRLGEAELRVTGPIRRCRVIDTNLQTGERDLALYAALGEGGANPLLGIYVEVTRPGRIAPGDSLSLLD